MTVNTQQTLVNADWESQRKRETRNLDWGFWHLDRLAEIVLVDRADGVLGTGTSDRQQRVTRPSKESLLREAFNAIGREDE